MTRLQKFLAIALVIVGGFVVWQQTTAVPMYDGHVRGMSRNPDGFFRHRVMSREEFQERTRGAEVGLDVPSSTMYGMFGFVVTEPSAVSDRPLDWMGIGLVLRSRFAEVPDAASILGIEDAAHVVSASQLSYPTYDDVVVALGGEDFHRVYKHSPYRTSPWRLGAQALGVSIACALLATEWWRRRKIWKHDIALIEREKRLREGALARAHATDNRRRYQRAARVNVLTHRVNYTPSMEVEVTPSPTLEELYELIHALESSSTAWISRRPSLSGELAPVRDRLLRNLRDLQKVSTPKEKRLRALKSDADAFEQQLAALARRFAA